MLWHLGIWIKFVFVIQGLQGQALLICFKHLFLDLCWPIQTLGPVVSLRASRVTVLLPTRRCDLLCMGTEGGAVRTLALPSLAALEARMLLQDRVLQR